MKIKLKFFGIISDITGTEELICAEAYDTDNLAGEYKIKYPEINNLSYRIAVNHMIINSNTRLNDGDEVAFLPPFSGG
ncbi:MAG TPA: MoaD/ThiS family protein [Ignavibacteria bacterium]|nr:MoaD/ThiS family protein [Ignavibacteria bacterium]